MGACLLVDLARACTRPQAGRPSFPPPSCTPTQKQCLRGTTQSVCACTRHARPQRTGAQRKNAAESDRGLAAGRGAHHSCGDAAGVLSVPARVQACAGLPHASHWPTVLRTCAFAWAALRVHCRATSSLTRSAAPHSLAPSGVLSGHHRKASRLSLAAEYHPRALAIDSHQ
jgi:hypothetical protein